MNEEEIKVKYILPWLAATGVRNDEIQLERSFSLKIGRNSIVVGSSDRKRDSVGARLDILIRRGDRNLLIVETKAEDLTLTDDDRDQAISYARLVHPIAPYAVVTNGKEFRLYDSLTKNQIPPSEIEVRGMSASFPLSLIEEAQELFLCASKDNLLAFCQAQVNRELMLIKGTLSELNKKYIPELHVTREAVLGAINRLNLNKKPGLILIGESGRGKTCDICWTVEKLLQEGQPVLFFNGLHIERDILSSIATEFCWTFGGTDNETVPLKRLAHLAEGKTLTVVVDGIDEWTSPSRAQHLSGLFAAAENGHFKLILSCKSSVVDDFLAIKGSPTHTERLAEVVEIPTFSDKEFFGAVDNYRRAYRFSGGFEDKVLHEAKANPFLLRVLFDVAHNGNVKHLTFNSVEFFESYYKRLLEKTSNSQKAETILKAIAGLLYEHDVDWLLEDELREKLGLHVVDEIMRDLFHAGILVRGDHAGAPTIGFYFQQLRDYIIAFKKNLFHQKSDSEFQAVLEKVIFPSMRGDVITLYYRLASLTHKEVLDGHLRENAKAYLQLYVSIIDSEFPAIRSKFQPETNGEIGFIGELFLQRKALGGYGFRKITDGDDTIYFYPVNQALGKSNLGYLNGADRLHLTGSSNGFLGNMDIAREVVNNEVLGQLRALAKDGDLYELNYPALLMESILQTIQHNKEIFSPLLENTIEGIRYPLGLNQIKECLWREKLRRHYHDELIKEKRQQGTIEESWSGSYVSYSVSLAEEEYAQIETDTEQAIKLGTAPVFHATYRDMEELESFLLPRIGALIPLAGEIAEPLFVGEAKLKQEFFHNVPISVELAKSYLVLLYGYFIDSYKIFIETNFPTFKEYFPLYTSLPVNIWIQLGSTSLRSSYRHLTNLEVCFSKSANKYSSVEIVDDATMDANYFKLDYKGASYECFQSSRSSIENLFRSPHGLNSSSFEGMTLRKLLYRRIHDELPAVEKVLREKYGVKPK